VQAITTAVAVLIEPQNTARLAPVNDGGKKLAELLGVELPVIQAPMAGFQASRLALAVAGAGGLGSLPCALLGPDAMSAELTALTRAPRRAFNVNFFCHEVPPRDEAREAAWRALLAPYYRELDLDATAPAAGAQRRPFDAAAAAILEDFAPPVVSFHFGLPSEALVARVRAWGAKILSSATTVDEARWLEARGVDAIIAQGLEAGGHRGSFLSADVSTQVGTFALVPRVVRAVTVPVIAAGGIADAAGVAAALALGASGVQVGTSYLLCPEAETSAVHRAALAGAAETAVTNLFSGRPARGIVNRLMKDLGPTSAAAPAFPWASAALAPLRAKAEVLGRGDFSPLWCGQNAAGARAQPAADVTRALTAGF
jgi:nitronate monooxygenase